MKTGNPEKDIIRRRIANSYLSGVISISLVLLLIGTASLLMVNARSVSNYFKENLKVSVLMKQGVTEKQADEFGKKLESEPFVRTIHLVTREEGTEELKKMLGEDFLDVFESSPVPISLDVTLKAEYVIPDSLDLVVRPAVSSSPLVDEIEFQQGLVEALNSNLAKISSILAVFILLMLFISFVLINNTVRLSIFARRFTIHTMQLVGATKSFIRKPFLASAVWQGLISAFVALLAMTGMLLALKKSFPELFVIFNPVQMGVVAGIVIVCGVLICLVSTCFVVNKLVGASRDDLYF
ncbi:MAG: permease-like cell division protein FtsX [Bacteroidales bacterium]|nr:permease-like cell division protein FtsX [Bacteroidales bacterium]